MKQSFVPITKEIIAATSNVWQSQCEDEDWGQYLVWIEHFDRLLDVSADSAKAAPHSRVHAVVDEGNPSVALALVACRYKGGKGREVRLMDIVLSPDLEEAKDEETAVTSAITVASAFAHTLAMAVTDYSADRFKIHANAHWHGEFLNQLGSAVSAMAQSMFRAEWEGKFLVLIRGPVLAAVQQGDPAPSP